MMKLICFFMGHKLSWDEQDYCRCSRCKNTFGGWYSPLKETIPSACNKILLFLRQKYYYYYLKFKLQPIKKKMIDNDELPF